VTSRKIYREKYYQAWRFGLMAEGVASLMLRLKGYRILARRFRTPLGEIDLVARRGRTVAFLEVKARADFATAAEAVTIYQQRRIINAAQLFLAQHPGLGDLDCRFDLVAVMPWRLPCHMPDAWRPGI